MMPPPPPRLPPPFSAMLPISAVYFQGSVVWLFIACRYYILLVVMNHGPSVLQAVHYVYMQLRICHIRGNFTIFK